GHSFGRKNEFQAPGFVNLVARASRIRLQTLEIVVSTAARRPRLHSGAVRWRRPCFSQETNPGRLVTEILLADDFQRHGAVQIDVERLVSAPIAPRPNSIGLPSSPVTSS